MVSKLIIKPSVAYSKTNNVQLLQKFIDQNAINIRPQHKIQFAIEIYAINIYKPTEQQCEATYSDKDATVIPFGCTAPHNKKIKK